MKKVYLTALGLLVVLISACETPKSPNFKLDHQIEAPLTFEKTYTFLGKKNAIIDTTKEDYGDVFQYAENGIVHVVREQEIDFANLDNAVPDIGVSSSTTNSSLGKIDFSTLNPPSKNAGSADFQRITGFSAPAAGQEIMAGSGSVNIDLDTEYFESAEIKENGDLELTFTNKLGFDIAEMGVTLNSDVTEVGQTTINNDFINGASRTVAIPVSNSMTLQNLNVDLDVNWDDNTDIKEEGENLIINSIAGSVSEFSGAPESQIFQNTGLSSVDESEFEFQTEEDLIELESGDISLEVTNGIDLGLPTLDIIFSDIVDSNGDPLTLNLNDIPSSSSGGSYSFSTDISGYYIKAEGGGIDYTLDATTENTQDNFQSSADFRTVSETDELDATVSINNLKIRKVEGYVVPKPILLSKDASSDGKLDVYNDEEADITSIDGLNDISQNLSDISFINPKLHLKYNTNLGINTTIYAVIAGTNPKGNSSYLKGKSGTKNEITSDSEIPSQLLINGRKPEPNEVIKFEVDTAESPMADQTEEGLNIFDPSNSNSPEFFKILPTDIRFVGIAKINKKEKNGTVVKPVTFEPKFGVDIPFNFSADKAIFSDTVDADLGDLPGTGEKDPSLSSATLTVGYENGIPMGMDLTLNMIDSSGNIILQKEGIAVNPASVNSDGFVEQGGISKNKTEMSFSDSELNKLNKVRSVELHATIDSPQNKSVKVRNSDTITFQINMNAKLTSTVN